MAETEITELVSAQLLAHVAWCKEQIAANFSIVQLPPRSWAGRDDLVNEFLRHFNPTDRAMAGNAVDLAVMEMWHRSKDDPANFDLQAMLLRLINIHKLITKAIANGRSEQTFKYEPFRDANGKEDMMKLVEIKVKEKRYKGVDMSAVAQLLAVERAIAELKSISESSKITGEDVVATIMAGIDRVHKKMEADKLKGLDDFINPRMLPGIIEEGRKQAKATIVTERRGKPIEAKDDEEAEDEKDE